jgi:hypothetical protein
VCKKLPAKAPSKAACIAAFASFDELHSHKLSHARFKSPGKPSTAMRSDVNMWSKDQGTCLYKIMLWAWRLRSRSDKSYDPELAKLKQMLEARREPLRPPVRTSGSTKRSDSEGDSQVAGKRLTPAGKDAAKKLLEDCFVLCMLLAVAMFRRSRIRFGIFDG